VKFVEMKRKRAGKAGFPKAEKDEHDMIPQIH
jgi:hypothetical protein